MGRVNQKFTRKKQWIMIVCFFLLILGPNLIAPFAGGFQNDSQTEKRDLAGFPRLTASSLDRFPAQMDSYINDHAAFRNSFLSLNAALKYKLLNYADSTEVIKGRDGWLFFTGGQELKDMLGLDRFSPEDLSYINSCIQTAAAYYKSRGIDFMVVLPPNKSSACRQYLPDGYAMRSPISKGEELAAYLSAHSGVTVIDPLPMLLADSGQLWYYKTDSHWNDAAGFAVSQEIIRALGGTPTPMNQISVTYEPCPSGDLADLFHLPDSLAPDVSAVISGYEDQAHLTLTDEKGDGKIVHIKNDAARDPRRIAVFRDSFGIAIQNTLPRYFARTDFYHWQAFTPDLIEKNPPDVIIYEIVERDEGRIPDDMHELAPQAFQAPKN